MPAEAPESQTDKKKRVAVGEMKTSANLSLGRERGLGIVTDL